MSLAGPIRSSRPSACSGLMYDGVPIALPATVSLLPEYVAGRSVTSAIGRDVGSSRPTTLANPQSTTRVSP